MMKKDTLGIQKNQVKNAIQKLITPWNASGPGGNDGMALTAKNDAKVTQPHQLTASGPASSLACPHEHDADGGDLE